MTNRRIILGGMRVALAAMTAEDQPSFHAWLQDPELRALVDDARVPTLRDQESWFERVNQPDRRFFSIVTLPDHRLIGNGGFVDIDPALGQATLRITIGDPDSRGKGFGSEAVALLIRHAFDVERWKRVVLHVLKTNERAVKSYRKSGFEVTSESLRDGKTIFTMALDAPRA